MPHGVPSEGRPEPLFTHHTHKFVGNLDSSLRGRPLYCPERPAVKAHAVALRESGSTADAVLIEQLAQTPTAVWLTEPSAIDVIDATLASSAPDRIPVFVVYMLPARDAGQFSAGGAADGDAYLGWVQRVAEALEMSATRAAVILEPDGLAHACEGGALAYELREERKRLISAARELLEAVRCPVYVDCGHARWLSSALAAALLRAVGARRFALNVSNYVGVDESMAYGERVAFSVMAERVAFSLGAGADASLGAVSYVIDVSRCGNGPAQKDEWCNPRGRAFGPAPTTRPRPGASACDALLWVKPPGESDGDNGGCAPPAGVYWPELALEQARNARGWSDILLQTGKRLMACA